MAIFSKKVSPEQTKLINKLRNVLGEKDFQRFKRVFEDELAKPPKIAVIGKAGVGKSSTINALFNLQENVSHNDTGTTTDSERSVVLSDGGKLSIIDMPGMGEDIQLDRKYIEIYKRVLPQSDVILYVLQANTRALEQDQKILREIVQNVAGNLNGKLVVGLNQVDKMGPGSWNEKFNFPSPEQQDNIDRKCQDIQRKISSSLKIEVDQIEYYSATRRFRLWFLLGAIIKSAGNIGWKFSLNPADPTELIVDENVRDFVRKQINEYD
jgi:uncharacterized protein